MTSKKRAPAGGPGQEKNDDIIYSSHNPPDPSNFLQPIFQNIPDELKQYQQWVVWKAEKRKGKLTKIPHNPKTGKKAKSDDPATWASFEEAVQAYQSGKYTGIGFELSAADPFCGWDLDYCHDQSRGTQSWAADIMKSLEGYTEISPSGTGLRIIVKANLPPDGRKKKNIEVYQQSRFLTITGHRLSQRYLSISIRQDTVNALHAKIFGKQEKPEANQKKTSHPPQDEAEILARTFNSRNGDKIRALYGGDTSVYNSQSEADSALCYYLAFWLDRDAARIDAVFRQSGLMRPKWDQKHYSNGKTYGQAAIEKAIADTSETYQGRNADPDNPPGNDQGEDPKDCQKTIMPAPEKFPDVLPRYYAESVKQASKAFVVPVEIPSITLLCLVSACVGRGVGVVVKSGWIEFTNLFIALVARSGLGKSPCVRAFLNAIFRIEKQRFDEYQKKLQLYQAEMEARKGKEDKDFNDPPEKPQWVQIYVEDATEEALTDALTNRLKGVLWYHDELSGLLLNLGRYRPDGKSDGPKARLMSAYDCGPWKRSRKSGDNAYIPNACLSIMGTMQPAIAPQIFSDMDAMTGFLPRINFVRAEPEGPATWTDETFDGELRDRVDRLVVNLLEIQMQDDGEPHLIGMSQEAKALYKDWFNEQALEPWTDFDAQQYEALSAKLRGQCMRFALILHILDAHAAGSSPYENIQADTMKRAIRLANWFKSHQRQIWLTIGKAGQITECSPLEKRIAQAIIELESQIENGMLPTALVTEKVNQGADERFQVTSRSVGKCYKKLGLQTKHLPDKSGRGVVLTEENLNFLKSNVQNVQNVQESKMTGVSNPDVLFQDVPNFQKTDTDVTDSENLNVPDGDACEMDLLDLTDVSDDFSKDNGRNDDIESF